jgi:hypothetical protein
MSNRHELEEMIAARIELASSKTCVLLAGTRAEVNPHRRHQLEDCGLAIAIATESLRDVRTATDARMNVAMRDLDLAWRRMEAAVQQVTGEPPISLEPRRPN